MSADLLAEFDDFYQSPPASHPQQFPQAQSHNLQSTTLYPQIPNVNEFQTDRSIGTSPFQSLQGLDNGTAQRNNDYTKQSQLAWEGDTNARNSFADNSSFGDQKIRQNVGAGTAYTHGPPSVSNGWHQNHTIDSHQVLRKTQRPPRDENVLFDAEDEQEDDDFGDFEGTQGEAHVTQSKPHINSGSGKGHALLMDLEVVHNPHASKNTIFPSSSSFDEGEYDQKYGSPRGNAPGISSNRKIDSNRERISAEPLRFDAFPSQDGATSSNASPTNIPPPALLLSLFPAIITTALSQLLVPITDHGHSTATKAAILEHPETQTFIAAYLATMSVLARIISGRKLRWKRDTVLAQSMRIGPASASGRGSGMKLTGIDKAENSREEREVAEVLRLWRAQLGRLRSAVTIPGTNHRVPELTEAPVVRVAKEEEGGIGSPKPCALCGLKRNERVNKVDSDVQDSFGEFWIEHWGHRACQSFWNSQSSNLIPR